MKLETKDPNKPLIFWNVVVVFLFILIFWVVESIIEMVQIFPSDLYQSFVVKNWQIWTVYVTAGFIFILFILLDFQFMKVRFFRQITLNIESIETLNVTLQAKNEELKSYVQELGNSYRELILEEAELIKSKMEIEEALKARTEFMNHMTHELRTPLTSIIGYSDLRLQDHQNCTSNVCRQSFMTIKSSGEHLLSMINELLEVAKAESGKLVLNEVTCSIRQLLEETHLLVAGNADRKKIPLNYTIDEEMPSRIVVDEDKLKHIIINILSNAIKFTDEGSINVRVSVHSSKPLKVQITISDSGIGMDESDIPAIFNPFEQVSKGKGKKYGGTGLGLTICKKYMDLMHGTIQVTSIKDVGTQFSLVLPVKKPTLEQKAPVLIPGIHLKNAIGLYFYQQKEDFDTLKEILKHYEAELIGISDLPKEDYAIKTLTTQEINLILMDESVLTLQKIEGPSVSYFCGMLEKYPKIIILTNTSESNWDKHLLKFNDFISKPFKPAEFVFVFHKWAHHHELEKNDEPHKNQVVAEQKS